MISCHRKNRKNETFVPDAKSKGHRGRVSKITSRHRVDGEIEKIGMKSEEQVTSIDEGGVIVQQGPVARPFRIASKLKKVKHDDDENDLISQDSEVVEEHHQALADAKKIESPFVNKETGDVSTAMVEEWFAAQEEIMGESFHSNAEPVSSALSASLATTGDPYGQGDVEGIYFEDSREEYEGEEEEDTDSSVEPGPITEEPSLTPIPTSQPSSSPFGRPTITAIPTAISSPTIQPPLTSSPTPSLTFIIPSSLVIPQTNPPTSSPFESLQPGENDDCDTSVGPLMSDGSSNFDTAAGALVDDNIQCGDVFNSGPAVFGNSCDDLVCIEANDIFCGEAGTQSAVSWFSAYREECRIFESGKVVLLMGPLTSSLSRDQTTNVPQPLDLSRW
ncbi:hypothetical protein IV203_008666 [Nitzschia inconspicua]|uniref:Uncharacterized protein n=1 Tax=Nitzschia inconspicua TaxID=303405 RepID=A0A9K3PMC6_9STRA|nr:hypothetical protein IV203_008666 [Nitzschia inconspicua]